LCWKGICLKPDFSPNERNIALYSQTFLRVFPISLMLLANALPPRQTKPEEQLLASQPPSSSSSETVSDIPMQEKEFIGRLTPAHFANGAHFDETVFASLVAALQKQADNSWTPIVIWGILFGFAGLLSFSIGGFIGNIAAVFCLMLALSPIASILWPGKTSREIQSACQTLGITREEINAAIRQVKQEYRYVAASTQKEQGYHSEESHEQDKI
jgi:hypothetical protein